MAGSLGHCEPCHSVTLRESHRVTLYVYSNFLITILVGMMGPNEFLRAMINGYARHGYARHGYARHGYDIQHPNTLGLEPMNCPLCRTGHLTGWCQL